MKNKDSILVQIKNRFNYYCSLSADPKITHWTLGVNKWDEWLKYSYAKSGICVDSGEDKRLFGFPVRISHKSPNLIRVNRKLERKRQLHDMWDYYTSDPYKYSYFDNLYKVKTIKNRFGKKIATMIMVSTPNNNLTFSHYESIVKSARGWEPTSVTIDQWDVSPKISIAYGDALKQLSATLSIPNHLVSPP